MIKFNDEVEKLQKAMLEARKNYVKTMFYEDEHMKINDVSYVRIPCTESYVDSNDFGMFKIEKYGAFINGEYVEIEYGYVNEEFSYVDNEYVKNSEIKFA